MATTHHGVLGRSAPQLVEVESNREKEHVPVQLQRTEVKIVMILELLWRQRTAIHNLVQVSNIIIHQTHYEKSDWSRAFNQFTIHVACELDTINVISAADITFIMSSSTSAWLLSPLECSPQKQNG